MTSRFGQLIDADEVFLAWCSQDIDRMKAALGLTTNAVDRHHLLQGLVDATFKLRRDPGMRALCEKVARMHLDELEPTIKGLRDHHRLEYAARVASLEDRRRRGLAVRELPPYDAGQAVPAISTIGQLARLLIEDGDQEGADAVRRQAALAGYP